MGFYQDGRLGKDPHQLSTQLEDKAGVFSTESLFGSAYEFSSPNHALLFVMYWIQLVLLRPVLYRANSQLQKHTASMTSIYTTTQFESLVFTHPEKYADKVARAMSYCLQYSMKSSLSKFSVFALCMISLNYVETRNREKREWCLEAISAIGRRGFDVSIHLRKLMAAQWERRWIQKDTNIPISMCGADFSVCDVDPDPLLASSSVQM